MSTGLLFDGSGWEALASNVVAGSCPIYFRGEKRICLCS